MTTYQLPDMPAKIPAIDDDKLKELLEKYATKLEEVLENLTEHSITALAAENKEWARAFVLLLQFGIWDSCNVARSIQLLGPHNLGRQTLSLARDSLEMVVNLYWIHADPELRMNDFLEYSVHYNERYRRALEEAGGQVWAWAQAEQSGWLSQVNAAWTAYAKEHQKQNSGAKPPKPKSSWTSTNTSDRGKASKMMERHEYIYFSQATHISPIIVEVCFEEQPVTTPAHYLSLSFLYQVAQLKRLLHLACLCFREKTGFRSPEELKTFLDDELNPDQGKST